MSSVSNNSSNYEDYNCRIFYDAFYKCLAHKDTTVRANLLVTNRGFNPYNCKQYTPSKHDISLVVTGGLPLAVTDNYTYPYRRYSDLMDTRFPIKLQFQSPSGTDNVIISTEDVMSSRAITTYVSNPVLPSTVPSLSTTIRSITTFCKPK
jgi:hypothetical protein